MDISVLAQFTVMMFPGSEHESLCQTTNYFAAVIINIVACLFVFLTFSSLLTLPEGETTHFLIPDTNDTITTTVVM